MLHLLLRAQEVALSHLQLIHPQLIGRLRQKRFKHGAAVHGTDAAEGTLLGTALNNPVTLGNLAYRLMYCLQNGLEVNAENLDYDAGFKVEGHRIWIDYIAIDATNIADATY